MGDGNLTELAVWVFLLALIAFFTWVRKLVEKGREGGDKPPGKGIGAAVREQIEKYMRAVEDSPMGRGFGTAAPRRPEPEPKPKPPPKPAPRPPQLVPHRDEVREVERRASAATARAAPALAVDKSLRHGYRIRLTPDSVRRAVILAELLGPPLAERKDHRLF